MRRVESQHKSSIHIASVCLLVRELTSLIPPHHCQREPLRVCVSERKCGLLWLPCSHQKCCRNTFTQFTSFFLMDAYLCFLFSLSSWRQWQRRRPFRLSASSSHLFYCFPLSLSLMSLLSMLLLFSVVCVLHLSLLSKTRYSPLYSVFTLSSLFSSTSGARRLQSRLPEDTFVLFLSFSLSLPRSPQTALQCLCLCQGCPVCRLLFLLFVRSFVTSLTVYWKSECKK